MTKAIDARGNRVSHARALSGIGLVQAFGKDTPIESLKRYKGKSGTSVYDWLKASSKDDSGFAKAKTVGDLLRKQREGDLTKPDITVDPKTGLVPAPIEDELISNLRGDSDLLGIRQEYQDAAEFGQGLLKMRQAIKASDDNGGSDAEHSAILDRAFSHSGFQNLMKKSGVDEGQIRDALSKWKASGKTHKDLFAELSKKSVDYRKLTANLKANEKADPSGFGDAARTANEVTGELEYGVGGQIAGRITDKDFQNPEKQKVDAWSGVNEAFDTTDEEVMALASALNLDTKDKTTQQIRDMVFGRIPTSTKGIRNVVPANTTAEGKVFDSVRGFAEQTPSLAAQDNLELSPEYLDEMAGRGDMERDAERVASNIARGRNPFRSKASEDDPKLRENLKRYFLDDDSLYDAMAGESTFLTTRELEERIAEKSTPYEMSADQASLENYSTEDRESGRAVSIEDLASSESEIGRKMYFTSADRKNIEFLESNIRDFDELNRKTYEEAINQKVDDWFSDPRNLEYLSQNKPQLEQVRAKIMLSYLDNLFANDAISKTGSPFARKAVFIDPKDRTIKVGDIDKVQLGKGSDEEHPRVTAAKMAKAWQSYIEEIEAKRTESGDLNYGNTQIARRLYDSYNGQNLQFQVVGIERLKTEIDAIEKALANPSLPVTSGLEKMLANQKRQLQQAEAKLNIEFPDYGRRSTALTPEELAVQAQYDAEIDKNETITEFPVDASVYLSAAPTHTTAAPEGLQNAYRDWSGYQQEIDMAEDSPELRARYNELGNIMQGRSDAFVSMLEKVPSSPGRKLDVSQERMIGRFESPEPSQKVTVRNYRMEEDVLATAEKYRRTSGQKEVHVLFDIDDQKTLVGHDYGDGSYATQVVTIPLEERSLKNDLPYIQEMANQAGLTGFSVNLKTNELEIYYVGDRTPESIERWTAGVAGFHNGLLREKSVRTDRDDGKAVRTESYKKRIQTLGPESKWATEELGNYLFGASESGTVPGIAEWAGADTINPLKYNPYSFGDVTDRSAAIGAGMLPSDFQSGLPDYLRTGDPALDQIAYELLSQQTGSTPQANTSARLNKGLRVKRR